MPANGHALLGASSSHRWLACPPSARLEEHFPDQAGEAAAEGTLAHAIAEERIKRIIRGEKPGKASPRLRQSPLYRPVMEEYVDEFTAYVMDIYQDVKRTCPDALLLSETRLDYSEWVPEGFGTGDVLIIGDGTLDVIDLKYGKGVKVEAHGNPQLRLYGLGAWNAQRLLYDIDLVRMHIVQPRLDHADSEEMRVKTLLNWAEEIRPIAKLAWEGKGQMCAGEHCRFCKAAARCRARTERQMELARYEFRDAYLLTNEEIGQILGRVDELTHWGKSVKDYARAAAIEAGERFPGWKLVQGRSNRKITDEGAAYQRLVEAGYGVEQISRLVSLTDLEEIAGKKKLAETLEGLIHKPEGKPTLVPETDARPAIGGTAQDDFKD